MTGIETFFNPKPFPYKNTIIGRCAAVILLIAFFFGCTALKRAVYEGFERDSWQFPDKVIRSLGIQPGDDIADLGSGSGYFTFRLADATGATGRVYAADVDQSMNDYLAGRAREKGYDNVEIILAEYHDPALPESGVDIIFTSNTYHHLEDRTRYFANVQKYLRPNGRIAVIDFREGFFSHFTPDDVIKKEMKAAGYRLQREYGFLPKQHFLVFSRKAE